MKAGQKTVAARVRKSIAEQWVLYLFLLPAVAVVFLFRYVPIYGLQIAFKNYNYADGILGSPWAANGGMQQFIRFVNSMNFWPLIRNTLVLSVYQLAVAFPFSIFLALMINQLRNKTAKKIIQTVTYAPHFISLVVLVGMVLLFLSPSSGLYGSLMKLLGLEPGNPMANPRLFRTIYVFSDIWQNMGWGSVIYLAALSGVDTNLYEAARIDGASRPQVIRHIDLPHLLPTMIMLLILRTGRIMRVGYERVYLFQNTLNLSTSEVISTYVYKTGLLNQSFSYSTAIDLFNTIINFAVLVAVNRLSRRMTSNSLW
jgi:ABC-type polysaccharide transport system permease subunit